MEQTSSSQAGSPDPFCEICRRCHKPGKPPKEHSHLGKPECELWPLWKPPARCFPQEALALGEKSQKDKKGEKSQKDETGKKSQTWQWQYEKGEKSQTWQWQWQYDKGERSQKGETGKQSQTWQWQNEKGEKSQTWQWPNGKGKKRRKGGKGKKSQKDETGEQSPKDEKGEETLPWQ